MISHAAFWERLTLPLLDVVAHAGTRLVFEDTEIVFGWLRTDGHEYWHVTREASRFCWPQPTLCIETESEVVEVPAALWEVPNGDE